MTPQRLSVEGLAKLLVRARCVQTYLESFFNFYSLTIDLHVSILVERDVCSCGFFCRAFISLRSLRFILFHWRDDHLEVGTVRAGDESSSTCGYSGDVKDQLRRKDSTQEYQFQRVDLVTRYFRKSRSRV